MKKKKKETYLKYFAFYKDYYLSGQTTYLLSIIVLQNKSNIKELITFIIFAVTMVAWLMPPLFSVTHMWDSIG